MTATMTNRTIPAPAATPNFSRRNRRICIDAHTEFVTTLVAELQESVSRLRAATRGVSGVGDPVEADPAGLVRLDREAKDIARLVGLLEAVDGPESGRRFEAVSLPGVVSDAAGDLDVAVEITGTVGDEHFVGDAAAVRTGMEMLLLALAGDGRRGSVEARFLDDRTVVLEGTMDLDDSRRSWQARSGRRVLEAEGFQVRLFNDGGGHFRMMLRVGR